MHSNNAIRHAVLTVVLLGALLALGLGLQGQRGVFETTEGRYSGVASEMLRLNDWLVPRLSEEEPHLTKPPLTYWLLAASINALGRTELAVRLPGAMAFVLTVLVVPGVRREGPVAAKRQDIVLYLVLWLVVPTIVFLLVKSRLPLYLLPQFAPLALVTAVSMSHKALRPYSVALKACAGAAIVLTLRLAAAEMSSDNDSRHAADQIAALPGEVPGEIVFVDARPYRGIAFYLGVEVEHVALTSETAESLGVETVDEELDDLEAERVWLVPTLLIDQFRTRAAAKGAGALTMLGEIITDGPFMALALESPSAAVAGNVELDPLTTGLVRDDVYCCHIPSEAPEDTKRRDEREPRPLVADE
jgi:hypothetical protein